MIGPMTIAVGSCSVPEILMGILREISRKQRTIRLTLYFSLIEPQKLIE